MKNILILVILLTFVFCKSDKISEESVDLNNRAVKFFTSEKYADALKYSEKAILADEKNYQAYTLKAQILIKKNK